MSIMSLRTVTPTEAHGPYYQSQAQSIASRYVLFKPFNDSQ